MSNETIESRASGPETDQPKAKRRARMAKATKKPTAPQKSKPKADRSNKKAVVIALMKRAKGATLGEIIAATKWQPHTVRSFVSIFGSKGGEKVESSKSADGDRTYKVR